MGKTVNFATIGTSGITDKFLAVAIPNLKFHLRAVYSRSIEKAKAFAEKHHADVCYDDLDAMASDPDIDAVYIASPNMMHYEHTMKMLRAGKHVLCEKAVASNLKEAQEMYACAKEQGVFLLEAMRTVHDPGIKVIKDSLHKIGTIRQARISYCQYSSRYDSFLAGAEHNIFKKECSAGALMDIGVYCVHALVDLFGEPEKVNSSSVMLRGDIDGMGVILAKYPEMAGEVIYSKITNSGLESEIQGEKGDMLISEIQNPLKVRIRYYNGEEEILYTNQPENNMKYETDYFLDKVLHQDWDSYYDMVSLTAMKMMDEVRAQCGIIFPADK